jgi:rfaE bifunctional protein nucleotidyltransferase chain/domain
MGEIISLEKAMAVRGKLQDEGKTAVFTNGHFDLLHMGHVDYLQRAKELGDVLIVGLNSDASTRALKGEKRPIIPQDERARMVAALACVDYVVIFEETIANSLVEALKPDLYVKGGDWGRDRTPPEAEVVASYGGQMRILPYLPEHSTTELIKTIVERFGSERNEECRMGNGEWKNRLSEGAR